MINENVYDMIQLTNLYPLFPFAVKEVFNEHNLIDGMQMRKVLLKLGDYPETKHELKIFMEEVDKKVIKANSLKYLARFTELWMSLKESGKLSASPEKVIVEKKKGKKKDGTPVKSKKAVKKSVDEDEDLDVDDKKPDEETFEDEDSPKPVKKVVKPAPKKKSSSVQSTVDDETSSDFEL